MSQKNTHHVMTDLAHHVSERRFLQKFYASKKTLMSIVKNKEFQENLMHLKNSRQRIQVCQVVDACRKSLDALCPEPEEGWGLYTYLFACDILFPDEIFALRAKTYANGAMLLLAVLQVIFDNEKSTNSFDFMLDFDFPHAEEMGEKDRVESFNRFRKHFRDEYIYEMMRLGAEVTPYKSIEHIAGVHNLAVRTARSLRRAGVPIDLALISGAAAGHDIGKFGCRAGERVPYLHYYYTDLWFAAREIGDIGHIAANHSTWDLEIENLSVESLVLIYADFRVKQEKTEAGEEVTRIYSLDASYDVILKKLDNLDETKRLRYGFVYTKLHDFEDYMKFLGVDLTGEGDKPKEQQKDIALMSSEEAVEAVTFLGIEHSIALMNRLGSERQFATILEAARGETNWKRLRAYINIFEEYATYLSSDQKIHLLGFLYEMLMHREGDIRRQAAWLMGNVILNFNAGYRKELPVDAFIDEGAPTVASLWEKYIGMIVTPDHKLTAQHKSWTGYTLKIVLQSMLHFSTQSDRAECLKAFLNQYCQAAIPEELTAFVLLDAGLYIPLKECNDEEQTRLIEFSEAYTTHSALMIRAASLRLLRRLAESITDNVSNMKTITRIAQRFDDSDNITLTFLKGRLLRAVGLSDKEQCDAIMKDEVVADIFLDNLKTATPWVIKAVNIKLLLDQIARGRTKDLLHIAAHFSNLIKVSERVVVRHDAGAALLRIVPMLKRDQRNEIAVELAKGLEVGEYEFSKYIPAYLGEFLLWLPPNELDELIGYLKGLLGSSNDRIVSVALSTVGVMVECYSEYRTRFLEADELYRRRRERMLGMLLKGLAGYRAAVRQEALLVIGKFLFGSKRLNDHEKRRAFSLCIKKMLFLIHENPEGELTFFYRAAALSHLCRFITDQTLKRGGFHFENRDRIAFFPGTFDPFTLSHKGIVREIRDMGFEVMLSIDEFSWSKKTQPRLIRRKIASISVSDEFNVHIFPDDLPVNIANPDDMRALRKTFANRDIYVVVGSDVVANASSYKAKPTDDSIHSFNHIIFRRSESGEEIAARSFEDFSVINAEIIELSLPEHLEDISSTRIRENIDRNRDISNQIDPVAQEYIYHNSLYLREPQYKPVFRHRHSGLKTIKSPTSEQVYELCRECSIDSGEAKNLCLEIVSKGDSIVVSAEQNNENEILGFISYRQLKTSELFSELQNVELASFVRSKATGRTLLITGLFTSMRMNREDTAQQMLTEALAHSLREECTYAIFYPTDGNSSKEIFDVFVRQGFEKQSLSPEVGPVYFVDMRAPLVLVQNLETTIKEPLSHNARVLDSIKTANRRLQEVMTILYPGNLVLTLSAGVLHHRLVEMVTTINGVSTIPTNPRSLGPFLCVPFGKILRGQAVPNTVTKTLHTDKVFAPDIQSSTIEAYPNYSPLESQVKTIKSFSRPVILVDDLIHAGDRMLRIDPLLSSEGIKVEKLLVGLLSGKGLDLMAIRNHPVDSVYYLANLRQWFVESTLYPFIGGDTVRREQPAIPGLQPSVNLVLPYATPRSLSDCSRRAIFEFSRCCLVNARDILLTLETEYRAQFERNLTLARLSEAVILPLCPDKGSCMSYDASLAASAHIENDLEMLMRMHALMV